MAREGINYPGWFNQAACSIRCQLARLWSAVGSKVAKVNTVQPDGDGKLNIVSDTANLIVTDDQGNNAIRLDLDAALQSPPVTSVNGSTGAVVLNSDSIFGNLDVYNGSSIYTIHARVKTAINNNALGAKTGDDALRTRMTAAEGAITAEQGARVAADNALSAQIATKASAGDTIVKNPTGPQTIYDYDLGIDENLDVNGDVDVGGTLDAAVATGTTGTYNLKAANNTRIKNELDAYAPMVRTTGNQTIAGIKTFESAPVLQICGVGYKLTASTYLKCGTITNYGDNTYNIDMIICERTAVCIARASITLLNNTVSNVSLSGRTLYGAPTRIYAGACVSSNGIDLYYHTDTVNRYFAPSLMGCFYSNGNPALITPDNTVENTQPTDYVEAIFTEA